MLLLVLQACHRCYFHRHTTAIASSIGMLLVVVVYHFYIVLFSALQQTAFSALQQTFCAHMWFYISECHRCYFHRHTSMLLVVVVYHSHVILHKWIAFYSTFWRSTEVVYLQRWHGWCHMKLLPSRHILCTPYNHAPCHFMQSHIHKAHTPSLLAEWLGSFTCYEQIF